MKCPQIVLVCPPNPEKEENMKYLLVSFIVLSMTACGKEDPKKIPLVPPAPTPAAAATPKPSPKPKVSLHADCICVPVGKAAVFTSFDYLASSCDDLDNTSLFDDLTKSDCGKISLRDICNVHLVSPECGEWEGKII